MTYTDIREIRPKIAMHDAITGNGGPMVDMACHLFDLMRWFYESKPVSVSASWGSNAIGRESLASIKTLAPDATSMTVTYANGDIGTIIMNWGLPKGINGPLLCLATGKDGLMHCVDIGNAKEVTAIIEGNEPVTVGTVDDDVKDLIHAELAVFDHFIEEIEGHGKAQTSFEEGILCLATSMAAIASGALGRPVTIAEIIEKKPTILQCMTGG